MRLLKKEDYPEHSVDDKPCMRGFAPHKGKKLTSAIKMRMITFL